MIHSLARCVLFSALIVVEFSWRSTPPSPLLEKKRRVRSSWVICSARHVTSSFSYIHTFAMLFW